MSPAQGQGDAAALNRGGRGGDLICFSPLLPSSGQPLCIALGAAAVGLGAGPKCGQGLARFHSALGRKV